MLILADSKISDTTREKLSVYGEVIDFATEGITYEAISGHTDIFFCPTPNGLIVAPNLPEYYSNLLKQKGIEFTYGQLAVGREYPLTASYNSLVTEKYIIQNSTCSEPGIRARNPEPEIIHTRQGYVRCNLISLPGDLFITSDHGIEKSLRQRNIEVLFVDSSPVRLDGFAHGFFGGACGRYADMLFVNGSMKYIKEKKQVEEFAARSGIKIVELSDELPVDIGSLLFL